MAKLKGGMALDFSLEKSRVKEEVGQSKCKNYGGVRNIVQ